MASRGMPGPAWVIPGVVLGFVLGGLGPRGELQDREAEVARLQDELIKAQRRAERRSPLSVMGLDRALQLAEDTEPREAPPPRPQVSGGDDGGLTVVDEAPADPAPDGPPPDMVEEFELAVEAQRIRARQSRQALIDQADLGDAGVTELDAVIEDMNIRLAEVAEEAIDLADPTRDPDSADLLRVTHEVSGILYDAQTAVDDVIGEEAVETVDPASREVWNHVDLEGLQGAVEEADARWGDAAGGGAAGGDGSWEQRR